MFLNLKDKIKFLNRKLTTRQNNKKSRRRLDSQGFAGKLRKEKCMWKTLMVARAGIEPATPAVKGRCLSQFDQRAMY